MAAAAPIPRIIRVIDFSTQVHAAVCDNDKLSVLDASRQALAEMDRDQALALRDAAIALQAMVETRLLVDVPTKSKQDLEVDKLVAQGWRVDHSDDTTIYLSKRGRPRHQTLYCQVDSDGDVGGGQ